MPSVIGGASGVLDSVNVKPRKELVNDTRICRKIRKRESREREEIARKYSTTDIRINYSQLNSFICVTSFLYQLDDTHLFVIPMQKQLMHPN